MPMVAAAASVPRIAVVGGGVGGLATAAFLHRAGLPCSLYEQAPELKEVGAGLVAAPNAVRLLRRLGVMDRFLGRAVRLDVGWEFRVHRADLLDAIGHAVPSEPCTSASAASPLRSAATGRC